MPLCARVLRFIKYLVVFLFVLDAAIVLYNVNNDGLLDCTLLSG